MPCGCSLGGARRSRWPPMGCSHGSLAERPIEREARDIYCFLASLCCFSLSLLSVASLCRFSLSLLSVASLCRFSLLLLSVASLCRFTLSRRPKIELISQVTALCVRVTSANAIPLIQNCLPLAYYYNLLCIRPLDDLNSNIVFISDRASPKRCTSCLL